MRKIFRKRGAALALLLCAACCVFGLMSAVAAERPAGPGQAGVDASGLFYKDEKSEVQRGYALPEAVGGGTGVLLTGSVYGATLTYTQVVDLSAVRGDLIRFEAPLTERYGTAGLEVTLVDYYDPENRLSVRWNQADDTEFAARVTVGYEGRALGRNNATGQHGVDASGTLISSNNFSGAYQKDAHKPFSFRFDAETTEVFVEPYDAGAEYLVLNAAESLGFAGFSTGEVLVEIRFLKLKNLGAAVVTELGGKSLSGAVQPAASDCIRLALDPDYRTGLPQGFTGLAYPVPQTLDGDLFRETYEVAISLTRGQTDVSSLLNAEKTHFTPDQTGTYTLRYAAKDVNGLDTEKVFEIEVLPGTAYRAPEISVEDGACDFSYRAFCKLPKATVTAGSGTGKVRLTYVYRYNNREIEPDEQGEIRLTEPGTVELTVTATDYLGTPVVERFDYAVTQVGGAQFSERGLPEALESGKTFAVPAFFMLTESGATAAKTRVLVDGAPLSGNSFEVGAQDFELTFEGLSASDEVIASETFPIKVFAQAQGKPSAYLIGEGVALEDTNNGVRMTSASGAGSVRLAKPVSAQDLSLEVRGVRDATDYEYLEIRLTDAIDDRIGLCFRLFPTATGTILRTTDENGAYTRSYNFAAALGEGFGVSFLLDGKTGTVWDATVVNELLRADYTHDGHRFSGFPSREARVTFAFGGANAGSAALIVQVSNQGFAASRNWSDNAGPVVYADGEIRNAASGAADNRFPKGTEIIIPAAIATDVLQTAATVNLSVTSPSGAVLISNAACASDTRITLGEYGVYQVRYRASDGAGRTSTLSFDVQSVDVTKPVITVNGSYDKRYKVGNKIKLHGFSAQDDQADKEPKTYLMIFTPEMKWKVCKAGEEFLLNCAGKYRIVYVARDDAYNVARTEFEITVTEGK